MRAICVDDEPPAVDYTLHQCECLPEIDEITGFTDPQVALDFVSQHPVDLCLLDINMPEIDGITLAVRIRKVLPGVSIIFLSAYKEYAFLISGRKHSAVMLTDSIPVIAVCSKNFMVNT